MSQTMTAEAAPTLDGCTDVDSHEMLPVHMWREAFGELANDLVDVMEHAADYRDNRAENSLVRPDLVSDSMDICDESVWGEKGPGAPGAFDLSRRPEVMDAQGIDRQLVYPTFGLVGFVLKYHADAHLHFGYDPSGVDRVALGDAAIRAHNDWCCRTAGEPWGSRARTVAIVLTESVEQMMADAEELIGRGVKALWLPNGAPPAGLSPADRALDPFYRLLANADVPLTFHIGAEFELLRSAAWGANVPEFVSSLGSSFEFPVQPYWASTVHYASDNYLTAMVLGGVFERHPDLRFGSIEVGASWIGPLADRLDLWANEFRRRYTGVLSMRPSEYLNRNVRVAPFYFEDVASYFDRHANVADVYCFSTDYPHREGGAYAKRVFDANLSATDEVLRRKFFTDNGALLLP